MDSLLNDPERFTATFDRWSPRVFSYARRQLSVNDAQDVVADTFLVAWRRWSDVPDEPLPWLLVVARHTIANQRRRHRRQHELIDSAAVLERLAGPACGADADVLERAALIAAVATLTEMEREAVLLVAWDALTNRDAATVAGCSQRAFEVRLSRARARLNRALADQSTDRHRSGAAHAGSKGQLT
ncbi:MAG: sigma-70 family RNA polymerase sigma factor [Jatrophihabitans sp.]